MFAQSPHVRNAIINERGTMVLWVQDPFATPETLTRLLTMLNDGSAARDVAQDAVVASLQQAVTSASQTPAPEATPAAR